MSWETYSARTGDIGSTKRAVYLDRSKKNFSRKVRDSLSFKEAVVAGKKQSIAVLDDREDISWKKVYALPGEELPHGGLIEWSGSVWLVTEKNADTELYEHGKMIRCNHVLKWINDVGEIVERWCSVVDGTKYLIGERSEDIMSIGDARVSITIGKDDETQKINRGARFLIDDEDASSVMAFQVTKPNKLYNVFNGRGVYRFILNEVTVTDNDNIELGIADYYNWHPRVERIESDVRSTEPDLNPNKPRPQGTARGWI